MGDLTAALSSGPQLREAGPGPFMQRCQPDVVVGHGLGDLAAGVTRYVAADRRRVLGDLVPQTLTGSQFAPRPSELLASR